MNATTSNRFGKWALVLTSTACVIAGIGTCYNLQESLCDSYQQFGSITCYQLGSSGEPQVCLTHPYQIVWPAIKDSCATLTGSGQTDCNSAGTTVASVIKTYECYNCEAHVTNSATNLTCKSATLSGDACSNP